MRSNVKIIFIVAVCSLLNAACADFQDVFVGSAKTSPKSAPREVVTESSDEKIDVALESPRPEKIKIHIKKEKKQIVVDPTSGTRLPITTKQGTYYFVGPGDALATIAERYKIPAVELAQINNLFEGELTIGRRLFIPNKRTKADFLDVTEIIKHEKIIKDRSNKKPNFKWPLDTYVQTSPFGWRRGRFHAGLDLSIKPGTPIYAAADGSVVYSKRFAGYGNLIVIKHAQNYYTAYAHTQSVFVTEGKKVKQGAQIATVGMTGRSSGPHLHFEVHKGADAIDPVTVMPPPPPTATQR